MSFEGLWGCALQDLVCQLKEVWMMLSQGATCAGRGGQRTYLEFSMPQQEADHFPPGITAGTCNRNSHADEYTQYCKVIHRESAVPSASGHSQPTTGSPLP